MTATDASTKKADEAGHTPEPQYDEPWREWPFVGDADIQYVQTKRNYDRARLCVNACTGLTADQVAAIPAYVAACTGVPSDQLKLIPGILREVASLKDAVGGADGLKTLRTTFHAKLAAFEAMHKALKMVVEQYTGDMADFVPEVCDALKLADDCEATK